MPSARSVQAGQSGEPNAVGPYCRRAGRSEFRYLARQQVAESGAEVAVKKRIDARVDAGRHVAEPRENGKQVRRHVTRAVLSATRAIRQVGAEERQPERHERPEHPDERLLRSSLSRVHLRRSAARGQHVDVDHRLGSRSFAIHERRLTRRRRRSNVHGGIRMSVTLAASNTGTYAVCRQIHFRFVLHVDRSNACFR